MSYQAKLNKLRKAILLLHDHAWSPTAWTLKLLKSYNWELIQHTPYNSNLASWTSISFQCRKADSLSLKAPITLLGR